MRYVQIRESGGPEVLAIGQTARPEPAPGQVLIRVLAAGVNRPDIAQRQGLYPPPRDASPILGLEVAGEVVALGAGAQRWRLGDRVCALTHGGGYAEFVAVAEAHCLRWPAGYDAIRAAVLPETYFTVWANLFQMAALAPGERLLVHGGSSGIGTTAIQLGRAFGATVYATAGSAAKCAACERLGAAAAIPYRERDFEAEIGRLTDGRGVDVILDIVGGPYLPRNLRCLALDGRIAQVATQLGARVDGVDLREIMKRRARLMGSMLRPRSTAEKATIAAELEQHVWPRLDRGEIAPVVEQVFRFDAVAEAHRMMESGGHIGKLVLDLGD